MKCSPIVWWTVAYATLTLLLTFPLVLHLSTTVPHDLGDPLLSASILWWNAHVMPLTERWWNGFAFYPAAGFMAYSDHRLGESLLATPLQWLGCSPVTAYNVTLLATFPLSAVAAHWLAFTLTKRHDASALCGLAYGFNPYRMAHIEHLELLAAFGMPAALAALHRYADTRKNKWLVIFAAALVLQGLCASYYLLFFSVFLALWVVWFLRWRDARLLAPVLMACAAAAAVLMPIAAGYVRIHQHYGFERPLGDIVTLSADMTSLVTASPLALLWGWTSRLNGPERQLFPGLTIAALAVAGSVLGWRTHVVRRDRIHRIRVWLWAAATVFTVIAIAAWTLAPWGVSVAGLRVSSNAPFKPMSLAAVAAAVAIGLSSAVRGAYTRRSVHAFYVLAAAVMFVCCLGPKPMLLHHQVLYEPPYAWLMRLPLFGSVRVPARFAMIAVLALAVSGALAFNRFRLGEAKRLGLAIALTAGILAESLIHHLPLPATPDFWPPERAAGFAAVLELPLGDVFDDMAAMYRATSHQHPVVNGNSGFEAIHYPTLVTALRERDPAALDPVTAKGTVLVVVHKPLDQNQSWQRFLLAIPGVTRLGDDAGRVYFAAARQPPTPPSCSGDRLPIVAVSDSRGAIDVGLLTDRDPLTFWVTPHPQQVGDALIVDLGQPLRPCAVVLSVGWSRGNYARKLSVDTSVDGAGWHTATTERMAGLTVRAALEDPRLTSVTLAFAPDTARFVRFRIEESSGTHTWVVAELTVTGARSSE